MGQAQLYRSLTQISSELINRAYQSFAAFGYRLRFVGLSEGK